jgi:hypothetical protein
MEGLRVINAIGVQIMKEEEIIDVYLKDLHLKDAEQSMDPGRNTIVLNMLIREEEFAFFTTMENVDTIQNINIRMLSHDLISF